MTNYHITVDSFGSDCPTNWEEIANFLNAAIDKALDETHSAFDVGYDDTGLSAEGHDIVNDIWERYCSGELPGVPDAEF